jgi:hypothetical protein
MRHSPESLPPLSLPHRQVMLDRPTTAEAEVKATRHVSAELTDDMTVADLIDVLEHLPFGPRGAPCTVRLDRGVATFLVRRLRER